MKLSHKPRIIYNDDGCTLRTAPPPHTIETISCALDYLKGTQVDCICWCVGEQIAWWPSKILETFYDMQDKVGQLAPGWKVSSDITYSLHKQGIDFLPALIQCSHAQGLTFVASFRMNDTHIKSYPNSSYSPEFWKTHQNFRIWDATDAKSYYNAALDYSFPEVRNRYRDAIIEVASNYDVDGVELDFGRTPYIFQPCEAWQKRGILTRFIRDIRSRLDKIGSRRKRPMWLILRIPSRPRALTTAGIDAGQWIKEGLPDILVGTELLINLNQSIEPWQSLCRDAGVLFYPSVEAAQSYNRTEFYSTLLQSPIAPRHDGWALATTRDDEMRMQRAAAQNFLAQKPDGIYMFNFPCRLAEGKNILHTDHKLLKHVTSLLHEMGNIKTLARKPKGYTFFEDLPIYVEANRPRRFHQTIKFDIRGRDIRESQAVLRFRQVAEKNPHADGIFQQNSIVKPGSLKYYLNDKEIPEKKLKMTLAPAGRVSSGFTLKRHQLVELRVPGSEFRDGTNTLAFEMPKFPHERDPYIYIYDLEVDINFSKT